MNDNMATPISIEYNKKPIMLFLTWALLIPIKSLNVVYWARKNVSRTVC